jgi:glycosyltransferase involved in cell wall biosynthesis
MELVLTHSDRADSMGRAGRQRVENYFSSEATGKRFLDVYEQLLDT